jgi:D-glycero-D-manno-heptose 1,7-bisphosphate phosphatase
MTPDDPLPFPAFEEYQEKDDPDLTGVTRCVFLDRDGVINRRRPLLVRRWGQFQWVPGVQPALARLARLPVRVIVVTNQDAVGHGYIRLTDLTGIHREMVRAVRGVGGRIDAVYACVHHKWTPCTCRKPLPGMLQAAAERYDLDLTQCWMVGDNRKDLVAGKAVGCRTVLVDPRFRTWAQRAGRFADHTFQGTPLALEWLTGEVARDVQE